MANCRWAILCREPTIDVENNGMTLKGIVEELHFTGKVPEEPSVAPIGAQLIALWDRSDYNTPECATARFVMVGPDGQRSDAGELNVDLKDNRRYRTRLNLEGVPVTGPGMYHFLVESRASEGESWIEAFCSPLEVFWDE